MGTLYLVGTPIGNLEDISLRALRVLKEVDLIAAEDTRHTRKLLFRHQIQKPLTSYHKFNIRSKTPYLINRLKEGSSIALVSDSGTPGISDPGYELIKAAIAAGARVEPIPGPSALLAALSVSGLPTDRFVFAGFLPRKKNQRRKMLEGLKEERATLILYESPHRLLKCLADLRDILGDRNISVSRELTKKFEETLRGRVEEIMARLEKTKPRGEFTLVVEGLKTT